MERSPIIARVSKIYAEYVSDVEKIKSERKFTEGLMGFGTREDSYPCHDDFIQKLSDELSAIAHSTPTQNEAAEVLRYIYEAPLNYKERQSVYWMIMAAHSLTECLFSLISDELALEIARWYAEAYPSCERLPVQNRILKILQNRSKERKSIFKN